MKAKLFKIGQQGWVKSLWMFLLGTIVSVVGDAILQAVTSGTYSLGEIHWKEVGFTILAIVITYLKKELFSNSDGEPFKKENEKPV